MRKFFANIICAFIPDTALRRKVRNYFDKGNVTYFSFSTYYNSGKNNKIFIVKDGKRKQLSRFQKIRHLDIRFEGNNNEIEIEYPFKFNRGSFLGVRNTQGGGNRFSIGSNFWGKIIVTLCGTNVYFKIGKQCAVGYLAVSMTSGSVDIGDNCLISSKVLIHDDGHCVIDYESGKLLNSEKPIVKIGNHCWLGFHTSYLKGADIPDDCIVGLGSIVTKKFDKSHCVIAGSPAKIVKEGISWHGAPPCNYEKIKKVFMDKKNKKSL